MSPASSAGERRCREIAILLIDDDPSFRMGLAGLLRDDGHQLLEFDHPSRLPAYETLGQVGLLVTDYEMPGQNGFELADAFHAAHPRTPIIMLTGLRTPMIEAEASRRGFVEVLFKPVEYDDVHELVHRLAT